MKQCIVIVIMFLVSGCKPSGSNCENVTIVKDIKETIERYDLDEEFFCNGYNDAALIDSATYMVHGGKSGPFRCSARKMENKGIKVIFVSPADTRINSSLEYIMGFNEKMKQKFGLNVEDYECIGE